MGGCRAVSVPEDRGLLLPQAFPILTGQMQLGDCWAWCCGVDTETNAVSLVSQAQSLQPRDGPCFLAALIQPHGLLATWSPAASTVPSLAAAVGFSEQQGSADPAGEPE